MKVDKNIPIPRNKHSYPLKDMEIGDSFFVEVKNNAEKHTVRSSVNYTGGLLGHKYATRSVENGIRIWRIE